MRSRYFSFIFILYFVLCTATKLCNSHLFSTCCIFPCRYSTISTCKSKLPLKLSPSALQLLLTLFPQLLSFNSHPPFSCSVLDSASTIFQINTCLSIHSDVIYIFLKTGMFANAVTISSFQAVFCMCTSFLFAAANLRNVVLPPCF